MTGSRAAAERPPDSRAAFSAWRAGRGAEAEALARRVLARDPRDAGAHYVSGLVAADRGALARARCAFEAAVALAPDKAGLRIALGNLMLGQGDDAAAECAFRGALALAPGSGAARVNLGTALKRQGRLEEAVTWFRSALSLHRGFPRRDGGILDPAQEAAFRTASRTRLEHDLEQLDYLLARGRAGPALAPARDGLRRVLAGFGGADAPTVPRMLDADERRLIGSFFNRMLHRPPEAAVAPVLAPGLDAAALQRRYAEAAPALVVVDGLLHVKALAALRRFCLEATIWFDCKEHGGYLGAYLHEGFDHPVVLALARALGERLPRIFGGHRLAQAWAFKYGQGGGTRKHADAAAVNVNLWITPDEACREPARSGLVVYDAAVPPGWRFADYNLDPAPLERCVAGRAAVRVPYRCNRAVIFDSSLIHESGDVRFRPGYANRRINVTLLFGERREASP